MAASLIGGVLLLPSCSEPPANPSPDPGSGSLTVAVTATWWDEERPATGVAMTVEGPEGSSHILVTDDSGKATVELPPGAYAINPDDDQNYLFDGAVAATVSRDGAVVATISGRHTEGEVAGVLFTDLNGDGVIDGGEELAAVDVRLSATDPVRVLATVASSGTGEYRFARLPWGAYRVLPILPPGHFVDLSEALDVVVAPDSLSSFDVTARPGAQDSVHSAEAFSLVGPAGVTLLGPAGAIDGDGVLTMVPADPTGVASEAPWSQFGQAVSISLRDAALAGTVQLEFPIDPTRLDPDTLALEDLEVGFVQQGSWERVSTSYDLDRTVVLAVVDHLSAWSLLRRASEGTPTNTPPQATITDPPEGSTFRAGDEITYEGSGDDAEDGPLEPAQLSWWANLHHDDHAHPFLSPTEGVASGVVSIPTVGETSDNIWYRFYLRVVDNDGAADTVFREIQPLKSAMTFMTEPAGLQILLDGQPRMTPLTVVGVVGMTRELDVASPQTLGDSVYAFTSWSDDGVQQHDISTPDDDLTYTATFTATGLANVPPSATLTSPAPGAVIEVNSTVTLSATASDSDGTVVEVRFYENDVLVGSDTDPPFAASWVPAELGTRSLTAQATDDGDATTTSAPVEVTVVDEGGGDVAPPTVQLTSPADGTRNIANPLMLTATASDNVGVAGVQFQLDGEDLGPKVTEPPYEVALPDVSAYTQGVHVVRARARDAADNVSAWSTAHVTLSGNANLPQGFTSAPFVEGLSLTPSMAFAPDGRLFICELTGAIRVVKNGVLQATPFVTIPVSTAGERGLLGVAFHPDFASNGWVYVHYTSAQGGDHNRISRFTASGDVAEAGSEVVLVELPLLTSAGHNGGALHFGADGTLLVAVGDNGTPARSQSLSTVFGKMLRFNDDGTVPSDNPFFGATSGLNRAIWALGLRNPFTFGVQPGTGRVFINDVGQDTWEEINEGEPGANYGWPTTEGPTSDPAFASPVFAYRHPEFGDLVSGSSIAGAAFYNPAVVGFPTSYVNDFFFADFVDGWIHRMDLDADNAVYAFARLPGFRTDVRVGPDGALYALGQISGGWGVYRIGYAP